MKPNHLFHLTPESAHWVVFNRRVRLLAYIFKARPPFTCLTGCVVAEDGDRWRVKVCDVHTEALTQ